MSFVVCILKANCAGFRIVYSIIILKSLTLLFVIQLSLC